LPADDVKLYKEINNENDLNLKVCDDGILLE
jgi:hypothetical protein